MNAPPEIRQLVERFQLHRDAYRSAQYNEMQVRREFVDPFFKALGWDVDNEQGYAEAYKDVIHEDALKFGGSTKAPDYCFRIGGVRKYFVETKRPSVNLKLDPEPAYQLRRYAWSAELPLSVLTDFEEFCVSHPAGPHSTFPAGLFAVLPIVITDRFGQFLLASRKPGELARVKRTTSSPATVLMSWWRLSTFTPVTSWTIASRTGRAVSTR